MPKDTARKTANKKMRQEALRQQLQGKEYIRQVDSINKELVVINSAVEKLKYKETNVDTVIQGKKCKRKKITNSQQIGLELEKAKTRQKILQTRIDLNFRRLAKVLPDLKSIEMTDEEGQNVLGTFTQALAEVVRGSSS